MGVQLEKGPSPIKLEVLEAWLKGYPCRADADYLLKGFRFGFRIPASGKRSACWAKNLSSVKGMEDVVQRKINKEVSEGRVLGPFSEPPIRNLRISPLGIVPKKTQGEFRLIHHLSFPEGASVNDAIPSELCSVRYTSLDEAVCMVRKCGVGAELAKCDVKSAFRLLPVHPRDFDLLGFHFQGAFYTDRALPMGCSISCSVFEKFSTFVEWKLRDLTGYRSTAHYLDDYLFCGKQGTGQCSFLLGQFQDLARQLGLPLAEEKTEGPSTSLTFLGIELDTIRQASRLPDDKLADLKCRILKILQKKKVTLRELQQIVGHLNFACRVIAPGRPFIRRLCFAMQGLHKPWHKARVTQGMREDLLVWSKFLENFNGISFWKGEISLRADFQVHSDTAGSLGFGIYFKDRWCAGTWPEAWHAKGVTIDLTFLEFFPIVGALWLWAEEWANSVVRFWCDNLAVVCIINNLTSHSERVMALVRAFTLRALQFNVLVHARHVPGLENRVADALSRQQMDLFRELAPRAKELPEVLPVEVWEIGERTQ